MMDLHQLGTYQIEVRLGGGRHADVYRAYDTYRKRLVALKVFKPGRLVDDLAFANFQQATQVAINLVHPHIAWVWEVNQDHSLYYLAERYIDGPSLDQVLTESGPLPWEQASQVIKQIAQGLDFAHAKGGIHGDIKPQNILLSPDLGAVLTDFGLANALHRGSLSTGDRPLVITPLYTPPEIWRGKPASPAADQYALACVLAEMLTGKAMFEAPTLAAVEAKHLAPPEFPESWPPGVPWQVEMALKRALAHEPAERFPSVGAFTDAPDKPPLEVDEKFTQEFARREAEARARREAEEQAQREAEEVTRLAALEQARREIDDQLRREAEARASQEAEELAQRQAQEEEARQKIKQPETSPSPPWWQRWGIWIGAGSIAIILLGLWLGGVLTGGEAPTQTPYPTTAPPMSTPILSLTATPTAPETATTTPRASLTTTVKPTNTPAPSLTQTKTPTPTITFTPSFTATQTHTPTPTRTPGESDSQAPEPTKWNPVSSPAPGNPP